MRAFSVSDGVGQRRSRISHHRSPDASCCGRHRGSHVVSDFAKYSSMHGVHFICTDKTSSLPKRIFYRLFFCACVLASVLSVALLMQESLSSESTYISSTNKDGIGGLDEDAYFPKYPRITICRRPTYRLDSSVRDPNLLEYIFLAVGPAFTPLTPRERILVIEIMMYIRSNGWNATLPEKWRPFYQRMNGLQERYDAIKNQTENFNITEIIVDHSVSCAEMFITCTALVYEVDCCTAFQPTFTSLGVCYSAETGGILDKLQITSEDVNFSFDLWATHKFEKPLEVGYEIHLSDPRNREAAFNSPGHSLINGFKTIQNTKLTKTSRLALHTPWHGLSSSCPRLLPELDLMGYGDRYFKAACEKRFMDKMIRDNCRCQFVIDQSNSPLRTCDPVDIYGCFIATALTDNMTGMSRACGYPCVEYRYESDVNFVKLGDENISRLVFNYEGSQYILKEYRTTTVSGLLSQIGGALGLYLGASVITALELITFLLSWIWQWFLPRNNRRLTPEDSSALQRRKKKILNQD